MNGKNRTQIFIFPPYKKPVIFHRGYLYGTCERLCVKRAVLHTYFFSS